jgi:hypothetical protein
MHMAQPSSASSSATPKRPSKKQKTQHPGLAQRIVACGDAQLRAQRQGVGAAGDGGHQIVFPPEQAGGCRVVKVVCCGVTFLCHLYLLRVSSLFAAYFDCPDAADSYTTEGINPQQMYLALCALHEMGPYGLPELNIEGWNEKALEWVQFFQRVAGLAFIGMDNAYIPQVLPDSLADFFMNNDGTLAEADWESLLQHAASSPGGSCVLFTLFEKLISDDHARAALVVEFLSNADTKRALRMCTQLYLECDDSEDEEEGEEEGEEEDKEDEN